MLYPLDTFHIFMARQQLLIKFFVASVDCYMDMEEIQIGGEGDRSERHLFINPTFFYFTPWGLTSDKCREDIKLYV